MRTAVRSHRQLNAFGFFPDPLQACRRWPGVHCLHGIMYIETEITGSPLPLAHRLPGNTRELIASGSQVPGQRKAGVSDNVISSRQEVADAPPEGARPQVHNAGCAMKPPGQSVGTDSKTDALAQKNVLTLAQAAGAACETAQDSLQMDRTVLGQNQHKPSCDKGSRQLPKSCTSTK